MFIWQLLKGKVLVRDVLYRFGYVAGITMDCPLCNSDKESIDHLFLHCPWTRELWLQCMKWWDVKFCVSKTILDWARGWPGMCPNSKSSRAWNSLFFALAWAVWEFRNQKVFNAKDASLSLAIDMVGFRVVWWFKYMRKNCVKPITHMLLNIQVSCSSSKPGKQISNIWRQSSFPNALKFNVDGSSRGNPGSAGIGGVLRDRLGKIMGLFSLHIGYLDAISAEVLAIRKACELCAQTATLRMKNIVIVSDSKVAVGWVNGSGTISSNCEFAINEIRSLLNLLGSTSVVFNYRASNTLADSLAKKGSGLMENVLIWDFW